MAVVRLSLPYNGLSFEGNSYKCFSVATWFLIFSMVGPSVKSPIKVFATSLQVDSFMLQKLMTLSCVCWTVTHQPVVMP